MVEKSFFNPKKDKKEEERLKEEEERLEKLYSEIDKLIEKYNKSGNEYTYQQAEEKIIEAQQILEKSREYLSSEEYKKYREKYEEVVISLLENWYYRTTRGYKNTSDFLSQIEIKENGKVKVKEINLSGLNLTSFYLPKLIDEIEFLNCSDNQLTELPELPNRLKGLYCSNNQLQQLPELPDGLEELDCSSNHLSKNEIEKIMNHSKYNDYRWKVKPQNI